MPEGRKRLTGATKGLLDAKQDKPRLYPALLGAYVDGVKQIRVGSRQDFVWCRMRGSSTEVIQAMNDSVGLHWDLPILVYRDPLAPGMWKVYGRDIRQYSDWEGASYLPPHADAHSFAGSNNTGIDPVWVFKRQYMPMLPRPVASGTLSIYIEADFWTYGGRYYWWPGSGTTSLASYRPTGALNGAFVTVYMDGAKKIPQYIKSEEFAAWYPPSDPTDFISLPTPSQGVALAAVFLTTGTEWIGWGEIYDLRQPAEPLFDELATGSVVIRDEGTVLGSATTLNFVGPGVVASMSGSYCQVTVPGPGVDQIGLFFQDDGVPLGTGTVLNSTYGVQITRSGTVAEIKAEPPITGSLVIYDENVLLGSALGLNFAGANVQAIISGTVAHIMVTGTAGGGGGGSGSVVILDESVVLGSAIRLNFLGDGVTVIMNGDDAEITIPGGGGATSASGICRRVYVDLASELSGDYYIVPNPPFVSGSLGVAINGFVQRPDIDYEEQYAQSGTFYYLATPPTGVFHVVWYERDEWCASSVALPVTGSIVIQDEGVTLGSVTELNFVGPNVDASIVGTTGRIFVTGSVGGGGDPPITGSFVGMDEDAVLGSALAINFLGAGVTAVMDGTVLDVTIPGGADPPISGSVVVDDEGVIQGSALELDFVGAGVTASVAAGKATITIPGGGGSGPGPTITGTCLIFDYLASRDGEKAAVLVELPTGTLYQDLHYVVKLRTNRAANVLEGLRYYFGFGAAGAISGANQYTNWSDEEGNSDSEQRSANDAIGWIGRFSIAGATANTGTYGVGHGYIPDFQNPVGFKHNQGDIISFGDVTGSYRHSHFLSTCEVGGVLRRILFVSANASNFVGESSIRVYGMGCPDHYGGETMPVTGSVVVYDEGVLLGSADSFNFTGDNVQAVLSGTVAHIMVTGTAGGPGGGATPRAGVCAFYTGDDYLVPDGPYITGSLMVFTNGVAQRPGVDFIEWMPESGVFRYVSSPPTGAAHVATWGKA